MDKRQKRKIAKVAIISGVILVSVTTAGTLRISKLKRSKRDEELGDNAVATISAETTEFNATDIMKSTVKSEGKDDTMFSYYCSDGKIYFTRSFEEPYTVEASNGLKLIDPEYIKTIQSENIGKPLNGWLGNRRTIIDENGCLMYNTDAEIQAVKEIFSGGNITLIPTWGYYKVYNTEDPDSNIGLFSFQCEGGETICQTAYGNAISLLESGQRLAPIPTAFGKVCRGYTYRFTEGPRPEGGYNVDITRPIINESGELIIDDTQKVGFNKSTIKKIFSGVKGDIYLTPIWDTGYKVYAGTGDGNSQSYFSYVYSEETEKVYFYGDVEAGKVRAIELSNLDNFYLINMSHVGNLIQREGKIFKGWYCDVTLQTSASTVTRDFFQIIDSNGCLVNNISNREASASLFKGGNGEITLTPMWEDVKVTEIKLTPTYMIFDISSGKTPISSQRKQLNATLTPSNADYGRNITWKSNNESIAQFSVLAPGGGYVSPKGVGDTTITATTDNGKSASCDVRVVKLDLRETSGEAIFGGDELTTTIEGGNYGTLSVVTNKSEVATGSISDGKLKINPVGLGTAVITVSGDSEHGTPSATYAITVKKVDVDRITLEPTETTVTVGGTVSLTKRIEPSNASNQKVIWTSSDDNIAKVNEVGIVEAIAPGTVTITVTTEDGNKTAQCTVTVVEPTVPDTTKPELKVEGELKGANYYLYITATDAESGIKEVKVNEQVITQKAEDGRYVFKPKANGKYTITAIDNEGNEITKEYEVTAITNEAKIETETNEDGKKIVYITPAINKEVEWIKVNGIDITKNVTEDGRYWFETSADGKYEIEIKYKDETTTEKVTHTENRFSSENGNGSGSQEGSESEFGSQSGSKIQQNNALTAIPKTGKGFGTMLATIGSGIAAIFTWFKSKKEK